MYTTDEGRCTATAAAAAASQLSAGAYSYKITFVTKDELESNAGLASTSVTLSAAGGIDLSAIPTSSDTQVIARKIYRTVADGSLYLYLARLNDNTTTTYSDTTPDLSLGSTDPPVAGSVNVDNSPPPKAGIVKKWKRTVFLAGNPTAPETVYFSEDDEPQSFPTNNAVQLDGKITGLYETLSGLVITTENGTWQCIGNNPDFQFDKILEEVGCVGRRACGEARLWGYMSDRDGVYLYDLNEPIKITEAIRDKFDSINEANIEFMHITHAKSINSLLLFNKDSSGDYTNNYIYQYIQRADTRGDLTGGWWGSYVLPSSSETTSGLGALDLLHITEVEDSNGSKFIYAGGDDGMIYKLFDSSTKNFTDSANKSIAVTTEFQSRYHRPGDKIAVDSPQHLSAVSGRAEPRYIEVRRTGTVNSTWTAVIDTADGSAVDSSITPRDTKTVSVAFTDNQTLRRVPIPSMTGAEHVRVKMTNIQKNVNDSILGVRLYYHLREGQDEV
jgi:hypothetical protein